MYADRGPEEKKMSKYKYARDQEEIIIQNLKLHVL